MRTRVSCCGFPVSRAEYFNSFNVVEMQQTFYQPPKIATVQKWHKEAPKGFEFTLKAWQLITHEPKSPTYRKLRIKIPPSKERNYGSFRPTDEVFQAWEKTKETADILSAKIIVFQCPASFEPTNEKRRNIKKFFHSLNRDSFIFGWEPRGKWSEKEINSICKELDLIHVVDPFKSKPVYGSICYYRLHGIGGYRYKYSKADLKKLKELTREKMNTYLMFNNVFMYEDAMEFKKLLKET